MRLCNFGKQGGFMFEKDPEDDGEDEDELFDEEDATLDDMSHKPSINEDENP